MNLTDKETAGKLIKSCQNGDKRGQQKLYQSFYGKMLNVCFRYAEDMDEAKDILQEGFIKVFASLNGFENKGSLEGWIRKIIVHTAIDYVRKKREVFVDITDYSVQNEVSIADTSDELSDYAKLRAEIILNLIQKLSPAYKTVFNLYVIEEYSHKEIAELLNISEGTSKSNYAKAKLNLKKLFDDHINQANHEI
ncbi:MAG: RNA polymerase sigma factor [Bacteroidota bacterium]